MVKSVAAAIPTGHVRKSLALKSVASRTLLAAVPVVSLGVLGVVPSLVIALRRRGRAHWIACAVFTVVTVGWVVQIAVTPVETHGPLFVADFLLLLLSTLGATLHCLLSYPPRPKGTGESA
ncbi:hypothetical protein [Streptomyces scopuliridis]|uniref:hypothetical protein n=1 Tax=Streptomyces scopuliridis TaxID=452529 RepID=UPI0036CA8752